MNLSDTADAAHRVASAAMTGGASVSVASGASMAVTTYYGLSPGEWQVIGIVGGLVIGLIGLGINAAFQYLNYQRGGK
jgi:hypothetical protein